MRFLADESCDVIVVDGLRAAGHDVLAIAEASPGTDDVEVIRLAVSEQRILLTEDKDFGQLVFAQRERAGGILFLRYPSSAREQIAREVDRKSVV